MIDLGSGYDKLKLVLILTLTYSDFGIGKIITAQI